MAVSTTSNQVTVRYVQARLSRHIDEYSTRTHCKNCHYGIGFTVEVNTEFVPHVASTIFNVWVKCRFCGHVERLSFAMPEEHLIGGHNANLGWGRIDKAIDDLIRLWTDAHVDDGNPAWLEKGTEHTDPEPLKYCDLKRIVRIPT